MVLPLCLICASCLGSTLVPPTWIDQYQQLRVKHICDLYHKWLSRGRNPLISSGWVRHSPVSWRLRWDIRWGVTSTDRFFIQNYSFFTTHVETWNLDVPKLVWFYFPIFWPTEMYLCFWSRPRPSYQWQNGPNSRLKFKTEQFRYKVLRYELVRVHSTIKIIHEYMSSMASSTSAHIFGTLWFSIRVVKWLPCSSVQSRTMLLRSCRDHIRPLGITRHWQETLRAPWFAPLWVPWFAPPISWPTGAVCTECK